MTASRGVQRPLTRLSINHATVRTTKLTRVLEVLGESGIGAVGLWRTNLESHPLTTAATALRESGVRVSSYTSGDLHTAPEFGGINAAVEAVRRALDEAVELDAEVVILRAGGMRRESRDLNGSRQGVAEVLAEIEPYALASGVPVLLEPLHPLFTADRGVVVTLAQALDIVDPLDPAAIGVALDLYNSWWDPSLTESIARGASRILLVQLADWVSTLASNPVLSRVMLGKGRIDYGPSLTALRDSGYTRDFEVEIFNEHLWSRPPADVIEEVAARFREIIAPLI